MGATCKDTLRFNVHYKMKLPLILTVSLLLYFTHLFPFKTYGANQRSGMDAETRTKYEAATPLNNTVKIVRSGSVLKLDYELIGTDGEKYNLWKIRDRNKPTFSIYQDHVKIGGGAFEFG